MRGEGNPVRIFLHISHSILDVEYLMLDIFTFKVFSLFFALKHILCRTENTTV